MNTLDILLGAILLITFYVGFRKGFVSSLLSFLRFFIAGYIAIYYTSDLKPYVQWIGEQEEYVYQIVSFVLCFLAVSILLFLISKLLTNILNFLALGILNRLLGGVFNSLKYALLISFVLFAITLADKDKTWLTEENTKNSYLFSPLSSLVPSILPMVSNFISEEDNASNTTVNL